MKTIIIILVSGIITIGGHSLRAEPKLPEPIKKSLLSYPEQASENNLEGMVIVSFTFNANGKIEILGMNSSHEAFRDHVSRKLSAIFINPNDPLIGSCYVYKINYRKEKSTRGILAQS